MVSSDLQASLELPTQPPFRLSGREWNRACRDARLAISHYALHPSEAAEEELRAAISRMLRARSVGRWRGIA
jgi:hypothetical protein